MKTDQIVVVRWIDAHAVTETWTSLEELSSEPCEVISVGVLLPNVMKGHVVLAQSVIEDHDDVDNVLSIPNGMVQSIESLHRIPLLPLEPSPDR